VLQGAGLSVIGQKLVLSNDWVANIVFGEMGTLSSSGPLWVNSKTKYVVFGLQLLIVSYFINFDNSLRLFDLQHSNSMVLSLGVLFLCTGV